MKEALYYDKTGTGEVHCRLCPQSCRIQDGKKGFCGVRVNQGGVLYTLNYGRAASLALDPIEKKPLYHFYPGETILSAGTVGCNLACLFCQNWSISQEVQTPTEPITIPGLIAHARRLGSFGVAYTYNEPFIWYEFVLEAARAVREAGLKNVLVTNGFVEPGPLQELLPYIDAANIDIKSIRDDFYRKVCSGRVGPGLKTIETMAAACHVELTCLVIPTLNDSPEDISALADWVAEHAGPDVPLHFSRYFPCYKMTIPPTPPRTLFEAQKIARKKLSRVYLGNI
ncbi:MAG: AmmeMemoRadiSam system radical SAM enzyme [Candidatus Omnitrophica bacterium]|nr:AmmeMemoRadiSam system radical SAM enzyme [Candidatus Omnitrophota bacterium]